LKRYPVILGFFALLLATAAPLSPAPAAGTDASGLGANPPQGSALNDTRQGLLVLNADPLASNLSRVNLSSPHGIVPQSIVPILLDAHGLGIATILSVSAQEVGFHSLLRAPPVFSLI
jgi:hypothetical protein